LGVGVVFGTLLQRVGASRYEQILGTLRLRDLTILKFMMLAIGIAMLGVAVLSLAGVAHLAVKPLYIAGVLVGGLVFGVGFGLSGYCPGTGLVACVEGKRDAWFTVAGAFAGALAYALAYPALKPLLVEPLNFGPLTLASLTGAAWAGVVVGPLFIALALLLPRHPAQGRQPRANS
ncbi:MAG TPA: YeeE/YedE thiosulfate transporter family protein, partial [Polyangia bacterium]